jgi:hypothetical protein
VAVPARLHYLKNVLGIHSFIAAEDYSQATATELEFFFQTQNKGNVLFLSAFDEHESSNFSVDELQLLEKIIVALKLKFSHVDIAQVPLSQVPRSSQALAQVLEEKNYSYVFLLGEKIAESFQTKNWLNSEVKVQNISFFSTFHPQDMLQKPDLKKDAWRGFQSILQHLPR